MLNEYAAGLGAGLFSVVVTFPINKLMFRQSAWGFDAFTGIRQLRIEGARFLYRGVGPPLLVKSLSSSAMFGTYDQFYRMMGDDQRYSLTRGIAASILAGGVEALICTPFERVQMILQDGRYNNQYRNMWDTFRKLNKYGHQEFFRGLQIALIRNAPSTFFYFGCLAYMEQHDMFGLGHHRPETRPTERFLVGAILGATISTVTYPVNVVRIRMQIQPPGTRHMAFGTALRELLLERGGNWSGLMAGIHANICRAFLFWGCMTAGSDWIRGSLN